MLIEAMAFWGALSDSRKPQESPIGCSEWSVENAY